MADSIRPEQSSPGSERTSEHPHADKSLPLSLLDLGENFLRSAAYSGIQSPLSGLAQVVDHTAGTNLASHLQLIDAPEQAKFGSAKWHSEQLGSAIGLAVPFFFLNKGTDCLLGAHGVEEAGTLSSMKLSNSIASATISGAVYGGMLTPTRPGSDHFWLDRLKNAAVDGVTFGTMTAINPFVGGLGHFPLFNGTRLQPFLEGQMVSGALSGVAGGLVSSELGSVFSGKGLASPHDMLTSMYGFGFVGGTLGAMHNLDAMRQSKPEPEVAFEKPGVDIVFGAGAMRGFGELGFLKYLEDNKVKIGSETGASFGSLVAALHTNGYNAEQSKDIIINQFRDIGQSIHPEGKMLHPWRMLSRHFVDLRPKMQTLVDTYGLKPNENLRILAYNLNRREPVIFEGTNYDLATALAASTALPGVMRPVRYRPNPGELTDSMQHRGLLVDGGLYRMNPAEFSPGPSIVAKASIPRPLDPLSARSLLRPKKTLGSLPERVLTARYTEPEPQHVVVAVGKPDVNSRDFNLTEQTVNDMLDYGYAQAEMRLHDALTSGDLPTV
jgi:hypothetical protein